MFRECCGVNGVIKAGNKTFVTIMKKARESERKQIVQCI